MNNICPKIIIYPEKNILTEYFCRDLLENNFEITFVTSDKIYWENIFSELLDIGNLKIINKPDGNVFDYLAVFDLQNNLPEKFYENNNLDIERKSLYFLAHIVSKQQEIILEKKKRRVKNSSNSSLIICGEPKKIGTSETKSIINSAKKLLFSFGGYKEIVVASYAPDMKLVDIPKIHIYKSYVIKTRKKHFKLRLHKLILPVIVFLIFLNYFLFSPLVYTFISGWFIKTAISNLGTGNKTYAFKNLELAKIFSGLSYRQLSFYPDASIKYIFNSQLKSSIVIYKFSSLLTDEIILANQTNSLVKNIFLKQPDTVGKLVTDISSGFDNVYNSLGFLAGDTDANSINLTNIKEKREKIADVKNITDSLSSLLGFIKPKTYLLILENSLSTRATGGKIEGVILATIDRGIITEVNPYDPVALDENFKGYVKAPNQIKKYLNQDNWKLTDANWDFEYRVSAEREIFLTEKMLGINVDGVITLDLIAVSDIGKWLGLDIVDYVSEGRVVMNKLNNNLADKLSSTGSVIDADYLKTLGMLMERKHLQMYFKNADVNASLSKLGMNEKFTHDDCGDDCYYDYFAAIDTNLDNNYLGAYLKKAITRKISLEEGSVKNKINIKYDNTYGKSSDTICKNYLRLYFPRNIQVEAVKILIDGNERPVSYDSNLSNNFREVGLVFEIKPSETADIQVTTVNVIPVEAITKYISFIRYQPGYLDPVINLDINLGDSFKPAAQNLFSLTGDSGFVYNSTLLQDLLTEFVRK